MKLQAYRTGIDKNYQTEICKAIIKHLTPRSLKNKTGTCKRLLRDKEKYFFSLKSRASLVKVPVEKKDKFNRD
ncbi:MAG: hypothetical protein COT45_04925 [bacterium (Candidatus Stahlbacteria) CG08_land_8_20_14_0_20_40_26]|nr:MAG: hypothetical protein COT45_04925 [bacterium (Candidatus Stahlbacteria) CG08_land_8_20_14_0_20_40_26]